MAAILQFRQGSKASFISSGPYISEPFFDTDTNIIHIGVSGSSSITLTKLEDINSGSFSVSGDISGSSLYLSGDITASNTLLSGDITIGGNIILGDQVQDNITVSGQFDSDLIPSSSAQYDLGSTTKKWNNLYAVSASISSIDLVANLPSGVVSSSNQIDTGSTHFQEGVELYSINSVTNASGIYVLGGSTVGLQIRGLSADGLAFDGPGNLIIDTGSLYFTDAVENISFTSLPVGTVSSSQQVIDFLPVDVVSGSQQVIDFLPQGTVSGSTQVISYLPQGTVSGSDQVLGGTDIVSSSIQVINFLPSGVVSGSIQVSDLLTELNSFTSSQNTKNTTLGTYTSSVDVSLNSLNSFTSSQETKNITLSNYTGSVDTSISSINAFTNSFDTAISINTSDVTILGNLIVQGTQTQLNTATLNVEDLNILLASGSTTSAEADGAGITIDGANKSLIWNHGDSNFLFDAQVSSSVGFSGDGSNLTGLTADSVDYENILNKPTLVSGSSQIIYSDIDSIPQNIVSSSVQVINFLPTDVVSGSQQVIDFLPNGTVSGSTQVISYLPQGTVSGSDQVLGGTSIVSSSQQVINYLPQGTISSSAQIVEVIDNSIPGLVSGSDQVTASLDIRYATLGGNNLLSSSNENFSDFSQSIDLRLLDTLSSGSETSQSLHTLVGHFPTSGALGTAAFYNVSSSLSDDPDTIPNVKAVYDYINNVVQAADITGVSASLGLFGGGFDGDVSLSLDTGSTHFIDGVNGAVQFDGGIISSSAQITSFGFISESNSLYIDQDNLAVGTNSPTNLGATQFTINDSNIVGTSGIISFTDDNILKSFDYVASPYRYIDTNTGIGIVLKPDSDVNKAWVIDTDGDLVSNGGSWTSGNAYMNNLIASSSITASNILVDNDIIANNFIGNIQSTNGVFSGSIQVDVEQTTNFTTFSASIASTFDGLSSNYEDLIGIPSGIVSGSSQVSYPNLSNIPSGIVSSSTQISNYGIFAELNGDGLVSSSQQIKNLGFVDLSSTQTISGTKTFNDIVVNGTGSFAYLESVQGSAKIIGDAFIVLNNDTPTSRYAGISVYDSGSAGVTASLQFDGQTNDWFYEYSTDGGVTTDHGVVLFGPEYSGIGSPTYLTNNKVLKGTGGHHLADSNITDDGTSITLGSNTNVSGVLTATTFKGMISGSSQVDVTQTTNYSSINQYSDTKVKTKLDTDGVLSGSISTSKVTEISNLTADEGAQLENINSVTISNTQWGYLGAMNQGVATGDSVNFDELTIDGTTNSTSKTTGALTVAGGVGIAKTLNVGEDIIAYASSDRRLKDEITPISNPIQKINQIGGYSFVWNTEKQHIYSGKDYGVIAQEIEEVLPELVDNRENGYKAVKYDKLVSLLIEGIKELSKEVEDLKKKIN